MKITDVNERASKGYDNKKECRVVNLRKERYDVYIGRGSKWGNPFQMANHTEEERNRVCDEYEKYFWSIGLYKYIDELKGKTLGCFCKPKRCHGDFLAKVANGEINIEEYLKSHLL